MRLIDADALELDAEYDDGEYWAYSRTQIENAPTIEPERKKGKWIPHNEKSREYIGTVLVNVEYAYWLCDICGYRVEKGQPMHNFCPNCGADMRGGEDDDVIHYGDNLAFFDRKSTIDAAANELNAELED